MSTTNPPSPRTTTLVLGLCLLAACEKKGGDAPNQPEPPVVTSFAATPASIGPNGSAVLSWEVTGATSLSVDQGVGAVTGDRGSTTVTPGATTVYTLTATHSVGGASVTTTAQATVVVDDRPFKLTSLTATPAVTSFGGSATLNWASEGWPQTLTLNGAMVPLTSTSLVVQPSRRQTYTLAGANGVMGENKDSRTIVVAARGMELVAGDATGDGTLDGTGAAALFGQPLGVAFGPDGSVFVADTDNCTVRKVTTAGVVTSFAGKSGVCGDADGSGANARFGLPVSIAADSAGTLYVGDFANKTIRKVTPDGVVSTFAGRAGEFQGPFGVALDGAGNLYVADQTSSSIRKVSPAGVVSTLAGTPGQSGSTDGLGVEARFDRPSGIAMDTAGNGYVSELGGHNIRRITSTAQVSTIPHPFDFPSGLSVDRAGNVYVASTSNQGGFFSSAISVMTQYGADLASLGAYQSLNDPRGVAVDSAGNVAIADTGNNRIVTISSAGVQTALAGRPPASGTEDGVGAQARFDLPSGVAVDGAGNTYVMDYNNATLRKVTPAGVVTTVAGSAGVGGAADGNSGFARFLAPNGVVVDAAGTLFVADTGNHAIRKVSPSGEVSTLAGSLGVSGSTDGTGSSALFNTPDSLALDLDGNLIVADSGNNTLRKVTRAGVVTTLAGTPGQAGSADGTGAQALFDYPTGPAVDATGNIFVVDDNNHTIRKVSPAGVVTTLAGTAGMAGSTDGAGPAARFQLPYAMTVDRAGNLFVTDWGNNLVRRVTPDGAVTTVAGTPSLKGFAPGGLPGTLGVVNGIALTADGDLIVACENGIIQLTAPDGR